MKLENQLNMRIRNGISYKDIQCCAMQIHYKNQSIYNYAHGYGNRENNPISEHTIFQVTSLTKPVISVLILMLCDQGKLQLDTPLSKYFRNDRHEITIRHLMTHTSGLTDVIPEEYLLNHIKTNYPIETPDKILNAWDSSQERFFHQIFALLNSSDTPLPSSPQKGIQLLSHLMRDTVPPLNKPNTRYEYCNYGYDLLSQIITMAANQSFEQFAIENLFIPLGLQDTFFHVPPARYGEVVKRYRPAIAANWLNNDSFMTRTTGYDGLKSSVSDMMRFLDMIQNDGSYTAGQLLNHKACATLFKNYNTSLPAQFSRSLGFRIHETKEDMCGSKRPKEAVDHGGVGGVEIMMDPKNKVSIVYFAVENKGCDPYFYDALINTVYDALHLD